MFVIWDGGGMQGVRGEYDFSKLTTSSFVLEREIQSKEWD